MDEGERKTLQQSVRDAWMGVLSGAEAEANRAAQRVLEAVGVHYEGEPPATMKETLRVLAERVRHNRDELERRVEEGVKSAAARVRRPLQVELETLRGRLDELQKRVDALKERERNK